MGGLSAIGEPVCKKRWSFSFALITSGISGAALSLCLGLVDILDSPVVKDIIIKPFLWLGMNPLFIFVAMIFFDNILMNNIHFYVGEKRWSLWGWINEKMFNSWIGNEYVSSLAVSILNLALWMAVAYLLYRKKIFIKL